VLNNSSIISYSGRIGKTRVGNPGFKSRHDWTIVLLVQVPAL
jgi:hypothetical protein